MSSILNYKALLLTFASATVRWDDDLNTCQTSQTFIDSSTQDSEYLPLECEDFCHDKSYHYSKDNLSNYEN